MKKLMIIIFCFSVVFLSCSGKRVIVTQTRSPVAIPASDGVFLSWQLYLDDPLNISFNVYRNGSSRPLNSKPLGPDRTNFLDKKGKAGSSYQIEVCFGGKTQGYTKVFKPWVNDYLAIKVEKPVGYFITENEKHFASDGTNKFDDVDKTEYTEYEAQDGVVADLDGDGELELVFFWGPVNRKDSAHSGRTSVVFIDAYKLDGTKLWGPGKYINCGPNIRAGNHYNTFVVDDFDGDGKAEIILKTAPCTFDTDGYNVALMADPETAWNIYLDTGTTGKIARGPEYVSVFDGATGKVLDTAAYLPGTGPNRGELWGDTSANRAGRFLSASAYLDGVKASAIMCQGYYIRTALAAYDLSPDKKLSLRWLFDTNDQRPDGTKWGADYEGRGNHNLSVADVDGDGKDDIIYGGMVIKSDGTPMFTASTIKHGDAMHCGDFDPQRPGLEVVTVQELSPFGLVMYAAESGSILWWQHGTSDTGRGLTADVDPDFDGSESWATNQQCPGLFTAKGDKIADTGFSNNMAIWWDGDTGRELFDGGYEEIASVRKVIKNGDGDYTETVMKEFTGTKTNSGTKRNPILQGDILGDWREEIILRSEDNTEIRIYSTAISTVHTGHGKIPDNGIPTLRDNHQYRQALVWQNTCYNQPPHPSWFIGYNMNELRTK